LNPLNDWPSLTAKPFVLGFESYLVSAVLTRRCRFSYVARHSNLS
jgi:hypothetical protein